MLQEEKDLIRELARQVAEIAHEPRMKGIIRRWQDVNALRKPDRAPVWCRPVGCWKEILPEDSFICQDAYLRQWEYGLRQIIHKRDIDDDEPMNPCFPVSTVLDVAPKTIWGVEVGRHQSSDSGGAWGYDPPLKEEVDFEKLQQPVFSCNETKTQEALDRAHDLLGDIMPVKQVCGTPLSATLGTVAAELRGLESMMMDMIADPPLMHRLMAYLRDTLLHVMDQIEEAGLLTPNHTGPMICSEPMGTYEEGSCRYEDLWCMANSQEFDQVSPAMWEEFCLQYQKPVLERFGRVAYGCCENLTHKIDGVLSIPNLCIFVCSAWSDLRAIQDRVGTQHCIMWRQKASDVVFPPDETQVRADLMDGAKQLQGSYYQIVLRELETLAGHPDRLHVWTRLAKEAAEEYA